VHDGIFDDEPFSSADAPVFDYVRELDIEDGRNRYAPTWLNMTENISVLERFTSVKTLHLRLVDFSVVPIPVATRLFRAYQNMTRLVLTQVLFRTTSQFGEFISNIPNLRSLALRVAVVWSLAESSTITNCKLPPSVEELELDLPWKDQYIEQFLATDSLRAITSLYLGRVVPGEVKGVGTMLQVMGQSLERLFINYLPYPGPSGQDASGAHKGLDLSANSRLQEVFFRDTLYTSEGGIISQWICDLLFQLNSSCLEIVVMELPARTMAAVKLRGLKRAMTWLTKSRFSNLRRIVVGVAAQGLEEGIRQEFKEWDEAGVLVVKYTDPDNADI
jgi:hypothetical protein